MRRRQNTGCGAPSLRDCRADQAFAAYPRREFIITAQQKQQPALESLSFEAALKELEAIVGRLEQGTVDLEDSIALYERGQALKRHCETKLKTAEARLEKIVMGAEGPAMGGIVETA